VEKVEENGYRKGGVSVDKVDENGCRKGGRKETFKNIY